MAELLQPVGHACRPGHDWCRPGQGLGKIPFCVRHPVAGAGRAGTSLELIERLRRRGRRRIGGYRRRSHLQFLTLRRDLHLAFLAPGLGPDEFILPLRQRQGGFPAPVTLLPDHEEQGEAGCREAGDHEVHLRKPQELAGRPDGFVRRPADGGRRRDHVRLVLEGRRQQRARRADLFHRLPGGGILLKERFKLGPFRGRHLVEGVGGQAGIIGRNGILVHWACPLFSVICYSGCAAIWDRSALMAVCRMKPTFVTDSAVMRLISW